MTERIHLSREGLEKLKKEYAYLTGPKRRENAKHIATARAFGDLKENAEYDAAKNTQAMDEKRIADLADKISRASILDDSRMDKSKVLLGATATLKDLGNDEEIQYTLVAGEEADFETNKISVSSPIGRTLLGHKVDDEVEIKVPAGVLKYRVLKITR